MKFAEDIIIKPVLSEKTYADISSKKYCFIVDLKANKVEIKQAIEKIFKVQVDKVTTLITPGKLTRFGKSEGMTSTYKKAYVTLKKDSKGIEFFEGMAQ